MEEHFAWDMADLLQYIAVGTTDARMRVSGVVVEVDLWNGRTVIGEHVEPDRAPDVIRASDMVEDEDPLRPFVNSLLNDNRPFLVMTGSGSRACCLRWSFKK